MTDPNRPATGTPQRSAAASAAVRDWEGYFDAVGDAGPRETLLEAVDRFDAEGPADGARLAIDLACGSGRDTIELLQRGWRVLALDGEREAIDRMLARPEVRPYVATSLTTRVARFDEVELPRCALLNASFALPFCPPDHFGRLWSRIVDAIEPGGRFAGQLFGDQDGWAALPDRTHHTREQLDALLDGFEIECLRIALYGPEPDATLPKRWHIYHVVARRIG